MQSLYNSYYLELIRLGDILPKFIKYLLLPAILYFAFVIKMHDIIIYIKNKKGKK